MSSGKNDQILPCHWRMQVGLIMPSIAQKIQNRETENNEIANIGMNVQEQKKENKNN